MKIIREVVTYKVPESCEECHFFAEYKGNKEWIKGMCEKSLLLIRNYTPVCTKLDHIQSRTLIYSKKESEMLIEKEMRNQFKNRNHDKERN